MPSSGFNDIEVNYGCLTLASEGVVKAGTNGDEYFVALARHSVSVIYSFIDINFYFERKKIFSWLFYDNLSVKKLCQFFEVKGNEKIFEVENICDAIFY